VQQQNATNLYLIFTHTFFVTQTSGLYSIVNSSLLKFFLSNRCLEMLRISAVGDIKKQVIPRVLTRKRAVIHFSKMHELL